MRLFSFAIVLGLAGAAGASLPSKADGPYRVVNVAKVGGEGGFDYVYADSLNRKLYVPRMGQPGQVSVYNLDTLAPLGSIPNTRGHGVASDSRTHHSFASSKPVAMWDSVTLAPIKTIDVDGSPDGILNDAFNHRTYVFSHRAPNATVIDDATGNVLGTIDLGGAPEQAVSDRRGRIYVDIEDKASVGVIDASTMKLVATYSLNGKGSGCAGLALDPRNHVLFVACREPQVMVMLDANTGNYLADLPIGRGCDGAFFNLRTGECFSSQGDGTLTVIKENSPTSFVVEQTVTTMPGAKTLTLDNRTNQIYLITAEYGPAPTDEAPGGRPRRGPMIPGSFSVLVVGK